MMIPQFEKLSRPEIEKFQFEKLKKLLHYVNVHSPYYKRIFKENDININSIHSINDLAKIPFTTKDDLQASNLEFLCVEKENVAEYCTTSGTLGMPVIIGLTANDLERIAYNEYLSFLCAGGKKGEIYHLCLSLDRQFMAGIAYYSGIRKLGATVLRVGPGNAAMHIDAIHKFSANVLVSVPSFVLQLIRYAIENNISLNNTSVKKIICIGENIRNDDFSLNALGRQIVENWNVGLLSTYASTEKQTAFTECIHGKGGHHHPELLIFEIIDEDGNSLPPGETGELTITTLDVEGMPLIRYRTGDLCTYYDQPCECGRTTSRLSPIKGRLQHQIKYKGTTVYPQAVFNVLNNIREINDYILEVNNTSSGMDEMIITVSLRSDDKTSENKICNALQSALRVMPVVRFASISYVQTMQMQIGKRKLTRFIDNRKNNVL